MLFACLSAAAAEAPVPDLVIQEFLAVNGTGLRDADGETSDWIELYNSGNSPVALADWALTDDPEEPLRWRLPDGSLDPGEFLVVFASGKDRRDPAGDWHTNFRLDGDGEYLALIRVDSLAPSSEFSPAFPAQRRDISFGLPPETPESYTFLTQPTPGKANTGGFDGWVADTKFSPDRGYFSEPFELTLTTATAGATIHFTLDGSLPSESHGEVYSGRIPISRTTVVRAMAFKAGLRSTDVDTQTYLFPADIIRQPALPVGFPMRWAGVIADYAMDPRIVDAAGETDLIAALHSLPVLSIVTDRQNLFDPQTGIYANPEEHGVAWERPASLEWFGTNVTDSFQVNCGLRIQGGWFRGRNNTRKHSFRVLFKEAYGSDKLRRDFFDEPDAVKEFDTLVFRAGANDGYSWDAARDTEQFLRDEFGRRLQLAMGHPAPRGRFAHLFLNGLYWGLYNPCERPNEDFSASYLGSTPESWDAINSGEVKSGSLSAWNTMLARIRGLNGLADYRRLQGLYPDGSRDPQSPAWLDAPNYIDYILLNLWGGNWDWPHKNYWFGRLQNASESTGFKFYTWDFENTMGNNRDRSPLNMQAPRNNEGVGQPHALLTSFPEYRLDFADRVQRHFFNDGVLTPEALAKRYQSLANQIESAILAESARWGDDHHNVPQDIDDWRRERNWILQTYLPRRTGIVLDQLRQAGLYPSLPAPAFDPPAGTVSEPAAVSLSAPEGTVYFTRDGSDPRLPAEAQNSSRTSVVSAAASKRVLIPSSANGGAFLNGEWTGGAEPFDDTAWREGNGGVGYDNNSQYLPLINLNVHSEMNGKNTSAFVRIPFSFDPAAVPEADYLGLRMQYDDGFLAYLNGIAIASANAPDSPTWNDSAIRQNDDAAAVNFQEFDVSASLNQLQPGDNILALHGLNERLASSDFLLNAELVIDSRPTAEIAPQAESYSTPIPVADTLHLKARAFNGTIWSALSEAWFLTGTPRLILTEINYHPAPPTAAETAAGYDDANDFEFLEMMNAGDGSLDLAGVRFVAGIEFQFPTSTTSRLAPGEILVLAGNPAAFEFRYNSALPTAGPYTGRLANGGERILALNARNESLVDVTYDDSDPWPPSADGEGYTLEFRSREGDPNSPESWMASSLPGGTPGTVATSIPPGLVAVRVSAGRLEIRLHGESATLYRLEFRTSLAAGRWIPEREIEIPAGQDSLRILIDLPAGVRHRFFRLARP